MSFELQNIKKTQQKDIITEPQFAHSTYLHHERFGDSSRPQE